MKIKRDPRVVREIKKAIHKFKREGKYKSIHRARAYAIGRARRKFA